MSATPARYLTPPSARTPPLACRRVLVVEDDPLILRLFSRVLAQAGFDVTTAASGEAAVGILVENEFCCVVSDIALPGMDGVEILRSTRVHDLDVPVILVTGAADVKTATSAIGHGVFQLLTKPVAPALLVGEVKRAQKLHELAVTRRQAMRLLASMEGEDEERAALADSYDSAIKTMWMAFQPIARGDGRLFGYEALFRAREPRLPNPPAVVQAAEKLGRLHHLGRQVRNHAASDFVAAHPEATLFVNLHARDLLDDALLARDTSLAAIAPRVVLEVTERASLHEIPNVRSRLDELRQLGFRIAIDDLGAGYAGLTSFTVLEPEFVKIDMSLVRDVHTTPMKRKLIRAIVGACKEMDITIVAEGIETLDERACLLDLGCDLFQGYLLGKPGPPFPAIHWA